MPPVENMVQKETADSPFVAGTWSCLPPTYEGTGWNPHLCLTTEYRLDTVRTSERLKLTKHPWPKGQTGSGQWKEANNSNISACGLSLGAIDKHPGVHIEHWNTWDTSLWNGVTGGSLTEMWNHTEQATSNFILRVQNDIQKDKTWFLPSSCWQSCWEKGNYFHHHHHLNHNS